MSDHEEKLEKLTLVLERFMIATEWRFKILEEERLDRKSLRTKMNVALFSGIIAMVVALAPHVITL